VKIKKYLIKTPKHLIPLFLNQGVSLLHSDLSNFETYSFFENIKVFYKFNFSSLINHLKKTNYESTNSVDNIYKFSIKGDSVSFWPPGYSNPIKVEFWGETSEKILTFNADTGRKIIDLSGFLLSSFRIIDQKTYESIYFDIKNLKKICVFVFGYQERQGFEIVETDFKFPQIYYNNQSLLIQDLKKYKEKNYKIIIQNPGKALNSFSSVQKTLKLNNDIMIDFTNKVEAGFISLKN